VVQTAQELAGVEQATFFQPSSRPQEESLPDDANPERSPVAYGFIREDASNEVVGGAWIATDRFIDSDLHLQAELAEHQRWLFAARLLPEARGRGLYPRLLQAVFGTKVSRKPTEIRKEVGRVEGTEVWAAINPVNHRSVRAHARFRIATAGRIHVIRVGSFALVWKVAVADGYELVLNPSWTLQGSVVPISMRIRKLDHGTKKPAPHPSASSASTH
ncbi:MAG: hypothetical protein ACF8AM_06000, partial [Rhodopirellula sp. JB055]|uniref:hypothetical protein n=1 Tax=Rhodopirellula sp. JB055 TaxID=3342846 RepID=UPI00370CF4DE